MNDLADESTPFRPRGAYAAAKLAAHWLVVTYRDGYNLSACNGILFNHESPLRPERFVTRKIAASAARIARGSRETLRLGNLNVRRDWGWAPEYVDAMWRMLQQDTPEDYVIATGRISNLEDFAAAAFGASGLDWRSHAVNDPALHRPPAPQAFAGNAAHAAERLGWKATITMPAVAQMMVRAEAACTS